MDIFDKYISEVIEKNNKEELNVSYVTDDINATAKVIKLNYSIGTGKATAENIEAKIEEMAGETITDDVKSEWKTEAANIGITYEEYLLELFLGGPFEAEERAEIEEMAESNGMTYQELLEYGIETEMGITFSESLVTTEELEEMVVELYKEMGEEITFDEETREQLKKQATNIGMTYREYLEYVLNLYGVDTSGVTTEISIGNKIITGSNSEFIATRNGTYIIVATTEDGRRTETQIEVTGIEEEKFSSIYETTTTYTDANGATATIPAGFAVGTSDGINTIADGLVITDAVDSEGYSIGNEFVWIPVESDETFIRSTESSTMYTEPYASGYSDGNGTEETAEYNTMRTQVLEYNGFYIGRYEAGINSITFRTGETEAQEVVVRRGVAPYNFVKWGDSMSDIGTNGAVYLSKNMYADSSSVTSTLCYGVQWDEVCRYIEGSMIDMGSDEMKMKLTGIENISKNIYDLSSNLLCEWTMEASGSSMRVFRKGSGDVMVDAEYRFSMYPNKYDYYNAFRVTLYINRSKN